MSEDKGENAKEELNAFEESEEINFFANQTNSSLVQLENPCDDCKFLIGLEVLKAFLIENILGSQFHHLHFNESMFLLIFENKKKDGFGVLKKRKHKETSLEELRAIKAKKSGPRPIADDRSILPSPVGFWPKIVLRIRPIVDGRSRPTVAGRSLEAEDIEGF
ncbi:hypothetical protein M9H77_02256 [Catharanthus roseus]|uniref:Uncharacterized protein n=1 Tax=Catharanthus roseus TaxID=4058 RepID=A0ACC0C8A1_CATRO|nr:hypothetical protein M9H77_02256 [Catharanthus roseus]